MTNVTAPIGLQCPVCRVDLLMSERQGIEIDYCPQCRGVWLDRGELDKIIESMPARQPNASFRLWLSSSPHPDFPIGILQRGIKMTTEPPKGLKANMTRLMNNMSDTKFTSCQKPHKYKKLLYALCWFHSVLVDRRKFQNLGWNIPYDFNDSDFEVSNLSSNWQLVISN